MSNKPIDYIHLEFENGFPVNSNVEEPIINPDIYDLFYQRYENPDEVAQALLKLENLLIDLEKIGQVQINQLQKEIKIQMFDKANQSGKSPIFHMIEILKKMYLKSITELIDNPIDFAAEDEFQQSFFLPDLSQDLTMYFIYDLFTNPSKVNDLAEMDYIIKHNPQMLYSPVSQFIYELQPEIEHFIQRNLIISTDDYGKNLKCQFGQKYSLSFDNIKYALKHNFLNFYYDDIISKLKNPIYTSNGIEFM